MEKVNRVIPVLVLLGLIANFTFASEELLAGGSGVTYDGRSLIINGRRELLFSGSIHYPRSTPEMWPDLLSKARQGGLNAISTYVFWNIHEPAPGQYNFEGSSDLAKFIKLVQKNGMYAILRIGPFIQAEWNHGGLPFWLREVDGITFRTNNEQFKFHMERFVKKVIDVMKEEKLFASQGGPIILAQIENEYNNIAEAFKEEGIKYIQWAGNMALKLNVGVPWVMCKQKEAPGAVIPTCNGRNCGDTFAPTHAAKPALWTENWTAQYRVFGDPPSQRSAEDLSYSVARFFSKNGTLTNYYMYHGGTNFGRTGAAFVMTRYYDEAPLDEFGMQKEPKWGHLRDLHHAIRLCRKGMLWGVSSYQVLGKGLEARVYEKPDEKLCVAFLTNTDSKLDGSVKFRGNEFFLPRHSVSILPDCKTVVYNTQRVNAQHNSRTFHLTKQSQDNNMWEMHQEPVPRYREASIKTQEPLELFNLTKDNTDYMWYSTSFKLDAEDLPMRRDIRPVLQISNLGHVMHAFVNGIYVGTGHGTKIEKSFVFQKPMDLKVGANHISLFNLMVGLPDSGPYMEKRMAGVHTVAIQGLNTGTLDLTTNGWGHEVGLAGEKLKLHSEEGIKNGNWQKSQSNMPVTWYKRYFDAPDGSDPVALDLSSMGKGMAWINGNSIGRYWISYKSPLGKPSQSVYHVPRSFIKPKNNLLVVFEEHGGKAEDILIVAVKRDNICTFVSEYHPAQAKSWSRQNGRIQITADDLNPKATLTCPDKKTKLNRSNYISTRRRYSFLEGSSTVSNPFGNISFASSLETLGEMTTLPPGVQLTGVATLYLSVFWSESTTLKTSSMFRPVVAGYRMLSLIRLLGPIKCMGKGMAWINGNSIGRYWISYKSPLGKPSQSVYHVPRSFIKPKNNLLVVFEEHGGKAEDILIVAVKRDNICTFVSEYHPAQAKSWSRQNGRIQITADDLNPKATLTCPDKKTINKIVFASFGNPMGMCGNFTVGNCHTPSALPLVEKLCLGKRSCTIPVTSKDYGADLNCPDSTNTLAVQAKCSNRKTKNA